LIAQGFAARGAQVIATGSLTSKLEGLGADVLLEGIRFEQLDNVRRAGRSPAYEILALQWVQGDSPTRDRVDSFLFCSSY
jgi:uncharacterized protein (DUF1330 family)